MKTLLLTIYAYSSFVSPWGPGPKLVENFKKSCHCEVSLIDMGDTNLFIDKYSRRPPAKTADIILGLDQLNLATAKMKLQWVALGELQPKGFVGSGDYDEFLAFDWAPLAFVYKKANLAHPPQKLDDLLNPEFKGQILLEDPRLSTPGLQFLAWVYLIKKEKTREFLEKLKPQIHNVAPSWSSAYGLFKKDQAQLVLSYLSSPVYHWKDEKDDNFASAAFSDQHAIQTEWLGIPKSCVQCQLAKDFVQFLLKDESQKILMDFNYMYPVNKKLVAGSLFERLPKVTTFAPGDYKGLKSEELIKIWKDVFK